jgi:hypothetical protein
MDLCAMLTVIGSRRDGTDVQGLEERQRKRLAKDTRTHTPTRWPHVPDVRAD